MSSDNVQAHSILGASSAHRWMNCTASVREIEEVPEALRNQTSPEAEEGTKAHEYLAQVLCGEIGVSAIPIQDEMRESVQYAVDVIRTLLVKAAAEAPKGKPYYWVEQKLDLSEVHEKCFGTADVVIYFWKAKRLFIVDYKHGKGLLVEVDNNPQLLYYGLGVVSSDIPVGEVESTTMMVIQPRCNHPSGHFVRSWTTPTSTVLDFAFEVQEKAEEALGPNPVYKPGEWCRWCAALYKCKAVVNNQLAVAQEEFGVVEDGGLRVPETGEQLSRALGMLPVIKAWVKAVDQQAYRFAMSGRGLAGYKLVEKRAVRRWINEEDAAKVFRKGGLKDFDIYETRKMKSPAQIEKIISRDERKAIESLISKSSSGLALVPVSDKRQEVSVGPDADFDVIEPSQGENDE